MVNDDPTRAASIGTALAAVDEKRFVRQPDGSRIPQSSRRDVIVRLLALLQPRTGDRVLEIGTRSGYSTALLSELVGAGGRVTSIDHEPAIVDRARRLLAERPNVHVVHGDGRVGHQPGAPYDRVIAWASLDIVPAAWSGQTAPEAIIVLPVAPRASVVRYRVRCREVEEEASTPGTFIPMTAEPLRPWQT